MFFDFINSQHPNIKFTIEFENDKALSFLDVRISRTSSGAIQTTTFRKPTFTGPFTNFLGFTPNVYKKGLVNTLLHRAFMINSSPSLFRADVNKISNFLEKNSFPRILLDRLIKRFKSQNTCAQEPSKSVSNTAETRPETRYFKLPYIGSKSDLVRKKILTLAQQFCVNVNIKLVFSPLKIGSFFSTKDLFPEGLSSNVVYKFSCSGCNASYIGETTRHLNTRITEHLQRDKSSHVFKHLNNNPVCKQSCNSQCFTVIDSAPTKFQLKIKEGLHIHWEKPSLNKQLYCYNISLLV